MSPTWSTQSEREFDQRGGKRVHVVQQDKRGVFRSMSQTMRVVQIRNAIGY